MVILWDFWSPSKNFRALLMNTPNFINKFRIVIATLPDRENCVCEIYYEHVEWAELSKENNEVTIQFYSNPTQEYWEFPLDIALEVLQNARKMFLNE